MERERDGLGGDTMLMPPVTEKKVRELPPLPEPAPPAARRKKRWLWLVVFFLLAMGAGFFGASWLYDKSVESKNDLAQQEMIFARQEENLRKQEAAIRAQQEAVSAEKQALEARRSALAAEAERAAGRNEQIDAAQREKSSITKAWEELTGKDRARQKQREENEAIRGRSQRDIEDVRRALGEAAETLRALDEKLAELDALRAQAAEMRDKAAAAYAEHEDMAQKLMAYIERGLRLIGAAAP